MAWQLSQLSNCIHRIVHTLQGQIKVLGLPPGRYPDMSTMGELIDLVESSAVTRESGRLLLRQILIEDPSLPISVLVRAEQSGLLAFTADTALSATDTLEILCGNVINDLPIVAAAYRAGNANVLNKLIGRVMKETQGRANVQSVREILERLLIK
jgi:aspartyl-tRNA(Asn)/glutamyl-tRNA(Gln) amidotransferase subunit B